MGSPVLGRLDRMSEFSTRYEFVVGVGKIGSSNARRQIAAKCLRAGGALASLIASTARVSKFAVIGSGTVVHHGGFVNADAWIGSNCIINSNALVEHDSSVGSHSHISTGAILNGNCHVGEDSFVGSRAVLYHNVRLGDRAIVASGRTIR